MIIVAVAKEHVLRACCTKDFLKPLFNMQAEARMSNATITL